MINSTVKQEQIFTRCQQNSKRCQQNSTRCQQNSTRFFHTRFQTALKQSNSKFMQFWIEKILLWCPLNLRNPSVVFFISGFVPSLLLFSDENRHITFYARTGKNSPAPFKLRATLTLLDVPSSKKFFKKIKFL